MRRTLRNIAFQAVIPVLSALIVLNAYVAWKNLKLIASLTSQRIQASDIKANIANLQLDLQTMETSQRGYLLTGDRTYLEPYEVAETRVPAALASLRTRLTASEKTVEAQLEQTAASKIEEMNETIRLRQLGYRHRAFLIVDSNRGKELMAECSTKLAILSAGQSREIARYDSAINEALLKTATESALAAGALLLVVIITFVALNAHRKGLEAASTRQVEELQATSQQLERFTSTMLHDLRQPIEEMRTDANSLLDVYGGFLPRQGQQKAERIESKAGQMIWVVDGLIGDSTPARPAQAADLPRTNRASA